MNIWPHPHLTLYLALLMSVKLFLIYTNLGGFRGCFLLQTKNWLRCALWLRVEGGITPSLFFWGRGDPCGSTGLTPVEETRAAP